MPVSRGTSNKNVTGNSEDRRRRKQWMLDTFGDGTSVSCSFECGTVLTFVDVTVDRYPIPGYAGGKYTRDNIRPACGPCNYAEGAAIGAARAKLKREGGFDMVVVLYGPDANGMRDAHKQLALLLVNE